jgi:hypothetical protein
MPSALDISDPLQMALASTRLQERRSRRVAWALPAATLLLAACGSSEPNAKQPSEPSVKAVVLDGVAQIRALPATTKLRKQLGGKLVELRATRASTPAERRGKALALRGFTATLKGVQARIDMQLNDSGKLEAAVRDAKRGDRFLRRGAKLLRAAGQMLGLRIGSLNGY